jgi:hypothetical protein
VEQTDLKHEGMQLRGLYGYFPWGLSRTNATMAGILLIDDDPDIRDSLSELLSDEGSRPTTRPV